MIYFPFFWQYIINKNWKWERFQIFSEKKLNKKYFLTMIFNIFVIKK